MKSAFSISLLISFLLADYSHCDAQSEISNDSISNTKSAIKSFALVGLNYSNDWVYMGRSDSIANPYLAPMFEYDHKSGMFINASISYLTAESENRIDLAAITVGYDHTGMKLDFGLSATGYFFSDESYNVQSEMTLYSSAYFIYDFLLAEVGAFAGLGLSGSTDGFIASDLHRSFYLPNSNLEIRPGMIANWGTQHYYNEYYQYRNSTFANSRGKGKKGGVSQGSEPIISIEEVSKFRLLDYEFSLQMAHQLNRVRLSSEFTYAIPLNPAKITIDGSEFEEGLGNTFFWSVGISYRLFGK